MGGQGTIPNDPQVRRGRNGPGGSDGPDSLEDARDVLRGRKTVEQAVREDAGQPGDALQDEQLDYPGERFRGK